MTQRGVQVADAQRAHGNLEGLVERLAVLRTEIDSVLAQVRMQVREHAELADQASAAAASHKQVQEGIPVPAASVEAPTSDGADEQSRDERSNTEIPVAISHPCTGEGANAPETETFDKPTNVDGNLAEHLETFLGNVTFGDAGRWTVREIQTVSAVLELEPKSSLLERLDRAASSVPYRSPSNATDANTADETGCEASSSKRSNAGLGHIVLPLSPPSSRSIFQLRKGERDRHAVRKITVGIAASITAALLMIAQQNGPDIRRNAVYLARAFDGADLLPRLVQPARAEQHGRARVTRESAPPTLMAAKVSPVRYHQLWPHGR